MTSSPPAPGGGGAPAGGRAAMARELHDLVAHRVGEIVIAAQAGQRAGEDGARTALGSIEAAGREGLTDLRRLASLLDGVDDRSVEPQPGLERLADLADGLSGSGLRVDVVLTGADRLPASLDLAAYRIVEAVLADVQAAGTARGAVVHVRRAGGVLDVEVCDDGAPRDADLEAVRARVGLFGGGLIAGSVDGGQRVAARLQLDGVPA